MNRNGECVVVLQYSHLYRTWKHNTGIKVNPNNAEATFDDDLDIWKLISTKQLKPADRKNITEANDKLREIHILLNRTILDLKTRSLSLGPSYVKQEFLKAPQNKVDKNKSVFTGIRSSSQRKKKK